MDTTRLNRALSQSMYLLSITKKDIQDYSFSVEGSTSSVYKVDLNENLRCTCIDFKKRHKICKHILFILFRVLKIKLNSYIYEDPDINVFLLGLDLDLDLQNKIDDIISKRSKKSDLVEVFVVEKVSEDLLVQLCEDLDKIVEIEQCSICFEDLVSKKDLSKSTSCKHEFHVKEIFFK
jgi:hypothetical protein